MTHKHGGDIYTYGNARDFSANINFRGMPKRVREAAICAVDASVHYPDPECRALRLALADREKEKYGQAEILSEHIICGNGAAELMFALAGACRPAHALLAVPSFFEYEQALAAFGCEITRFFLSPKQSFYLGRGFLDAAVSFAESASAGDMVILGNPNNPTGRLIESEILQILIRLCREKQILAVLDESFIDFLNENDWKRTFSGAREIPENPHIFVIRSFTKIYAMPGIRFGYGLCANRSLLGGMRELMQPWNVSLIAQEAARAAASEYEFAIRSAYETALCREEMKEEFADLGYQVFPSDTNFLLVRGREDLADFCLKHGFLIRSCDNFPGLERTGDGLAYFRICVRNREENEALLHVIKHQADMR